MPNLRNEVVDVKSVADYLGVRRRWWHSRKAIARNVANKLREKVHVTDCAFEGYMGLRTRHCVAEQFLLSTDSMGGPNFKQWLYHYSDGTTETLTMQLPTGGTGDGQYNKSLF